MKYIIKPLNKKTWQCYCNDCKVCDDCNNCEVYHESIAAVK